MPVATSKSGTFTPVPVGSHVARCYAVISLGTQHDDRYPDAFKVTIGWEIPAERVKVDGQERPMTISKDYTLSLSQKARLRADLESWRGRQFTQEELNGFVVEKVLGQPCILSVIHKQTAAGKTYAAIASVGMLGKGMECQAAYHPKIHFEVEMGRNDVFNALPEYVRKKIEACEEWSGSSSHTQAEPEPTADPNFDSVPF